MYRRRARAHSAGICGRSLMPLLYGLSAAAAFLRAVLRPGRGRAADGIVAERGPAAHPVVLVGVVGGPPPVPRRCRPLAGALVLPEPGPPAGPVLLVPFLPLAVQGGRAGRLGDLGQGGGAAAHAARAPGG